MKGILLGQQQAYESQYNPDLLQPIARSISRANLTGVDFFGEDVWTGYELSWLDSQGKPQVAIAEFRVPCDSPFLIESKSFKYYLNSLNQTRYGAWADVSALLVADLSAAAGADVGVKLFSLSDFARKRAAAELLGECVDACDFSDVAYSPKPEVLKVQAATASSAGGSTGEQVLVSHLLKSNCPVTGQPDWASVWVGVKGAECDKSGLLAYVVSFREHQDFHENCVERMYNDLHQQLNPQELWVYARYTRRGGLDINPFRASKPMAVPNVFGVRQ